MRCQISKSGIKGTNGIKAFTVAEALVSVLIVTIGAAGLMGCFSYAFFVTQMTRENQRATQIMLERTEAIRLCNWDQVITPGFIPASFTDYYNPTTHGATGTVYRGSVAITAFPYATSYAPNMRQLTMTVNWQTGRISRSRTNITNIARDGIQNYVY